MEKVTVFPMQAKNFAIAMSSVATYIDILVEIKARIVDLQNSKYNHYIDRSFANLDTQVKTMLETSYVPDELAVNFNMLYENYPLHKFSNAKAEGVSRITAETRFIDFSTRLYLCCNQSFPDGTAGRILSLYHPKELPE